MSIVSGVDIKRYIAQGRIAIEPFDEEHVNPASVDLTLGSGVAVYEDWVCCGAADEHERRLKLGIPPAHAPFDGRDLRSAGYHVHDTRMEPSVRRFTMDRGQGWVLHPGVLYLMHTRERVHTEEFVPVLDGKSSIGRLGIIIHLTAGFGDPGFDGQYTLEVTCVHPVRVFPGMRFCQMRFHQLSGPPVSYQRTGNYVGKSAFGPVPSKAHLQFGALEEDS